ncbi:uncharacterized protein LOC126896216 [Daktulosphaira vitifoliae]|uniref:uncharacterized protein LOC126896216 n=1 Tax=Daktulosphaira vitifoliae TaxID=58002 RepID=UPI0021A9FA4A|nr:uncharacterized protein LOC126896216 [Daktulosphaira vitifoliae]
MRSEFKNNFSYKCLRKVSIIFGTWSYSTKAEKIVTNVISIIWGLAIFANHIDYEIKPWIDNSLKKSKQDAAFEKIIRLHFWTFNGISLINCLLPLINRNTIFVESNTNQTTLSSIFNSWKMIIIVLILFSGNVIPALLFYKFLKSDKDANVIYNKLFQDICKLGPLTVDLQFVWFCYSLRDKFKSLNDSLINFSDPTLNKIVWSIEISTRKKGQIHWAHEKYKTLTENVYLLNNVYEERIMVNMLCYMFNTVCDLFNTLSAFKDEESSRILVVVSLLWVVHNITRITLVCFAASAVIQQDERVHELALAAEEVLVTKHSHSNFEMKRFLRRLIYTKVKFDVCGIMKLDKSLLSTAMIMVISYLVLVLQYNYT